MELTTRELATVIIFVSIVVLAFLLSKDRKSIRESLLGVVKAFLAWKVWSVILVLLLSSVAIVFLAASLGLWTVDLLKDTVIVILFTGVPLLMTSVSTKSGGELIKYLFKEILGVTAFLVAYVNLAPFALWGELLLQATVLFLVMCAAVAHRDPNTKVVAKACNFLLAMAGIGLIVYTTQSIFSEMDAFNWAYEVRVFVLSILLPLLLISVVYPIGFISASEMAMLRLRFGSSSKKVPRRVKLAVVLGFHGRLSFASRFRPDWGAEAAKEYTYRGARRVMKQYRKAVRQAASDIRLKRLQAKKAVGSYGVDDEGHWKDRREFQETKTVLTSLFFSQMGFARNHEGSFSDNPLSLLLPSELSKLPESHGIEVKLSRNKRSWLAYRTTIGGFCLAIGGRSAVLNEEWHYSGVDVPADFPSSEDPAWRLAGVEDDQIDEWGKSDHELPDVLSPYDFRLRVGDDGSSG